ncbi:MAG TPA: JAB domain-containing protein [Thermoanaerobacterales bacterium]|nr:JAB domain-containing protein [Thermoanaerobacterales bacterium]
MYIANKVKLLMVREDTIEYSEPIRSPDVVVEIARDLNMDKFPEEHMYLLCLDTKMYITAISQISHGVISSCLLSVREVFKYAFNSNACNIILVHNHPSGDPTPSNEDIEVTKRIKEAGELLNIPLMDHIIIGKRAVSLKEDGYI